VEQRDTAISIWVVLDCGDSRRDSVFVAFEIDYPVTLLMAASPVAGCLPAIVISTAGRMFLCQQ